ncbi:MAG: 2,3-bisphosphoglycerate-independent phosphoglycerate mutase, partial [Christensenellales bacterium]
IIFFNFRPDRARELTRAFIFEDFDKFERKTGFLNPLYVGMTQYDATFKNILTAFKPQSLKNTLGEYLASKGKKQLRIAETEKYAHVTFFFNGGVEKPNADEDRVLVPSPKVPTYDLQPEMSAMEIADKAVELIESQKYDVIILNFANCDMVGHTGIYDAALKAVQAVDKALKKVVEAIKSQGGSVLITADHGNADKMYDEEGLPFTAHTNNSVPLIYVGGESVKLRKDGILADIAPTMLDIMGLEKPPEMTGKSLIEK